MQEINGPGAPAAVAQAGAEVYRARLIKRHRPTKAEVERRRENLFAIVEVMKPMTVWQVCYQASVRGIVEKSETGYNKVQTDLVLIRKAGEMTFDWLAHNERCQRKPLTFGGIEQGLPETARLYRR